MNVAAPTHSWLWTLSRVVLPAVLLTALVVTFLMWTLQRAAPTSSRQLSLTIIPPTGVRLRPVGTMASTPHISPDGSAVMFECADSRMLYVRRLDSLDLLEVAGSDVVTNESFWHGSGAITFPTGSHGNSLASVCLTALRKR